jgi:hypothetical protein
MTAASRSAVVDLSASGEFDTSTATMISDGLYGSLEVMRKIGSKADQ